MAAPRKILIATDKFKGSMTAREACLAIARGLARLDPNIETHICPVADGGEGMSRALTDAAGGEWIETTVSDPLGSPVVAGYGWIAETQTAAIEMAEASGLWRVGDQQNDPWRASTYGTGEMIGHAIKQGAEHILLGIGGSATNDGGTGMAQALGYRFLDTDGNALDMPSKIKHISQIIAPSTTTWPRVTVACDVTNPVLGPAGCTAVYGPQKGIAADDFRAHEDRLGHLIEITQRQEAATAPGSGAAGGLGFGCSVFLNAQLVPGFKMIAEAIDLQRWIDWADLVITGEGQIDSQSLQGKAPTGVATMAKASGKPIHAYCGALANESSDWSATFDQVTPIDRGEIPLHEAIKRGPELLENTVANQSPALSQTLPLDR